MPTGTVRQYANAKRKGHFQEVYKEIADGKFKDEGAVVVKIQKDTLRVRWN